MKRQANLYLFFLGGYLLVEHFSEFEVRSEEAWRVRRSASRRGRRLLTRRSRARSGRRAGLVGSGLSLGSLGSTSGSRIARLCAVGRGVMRGEVTVGSGCLGAGRISSRSG